jgi:hypothetical protein
MESFKSQLRITAMKMLIATILIVVMWGGVGCVEKQKSNTAREHVWAVWCKDSGTEDRPISFRLQYLSEKKLSLSEEDELCKKAVTND